MPFNDNVIKWLFACLLLTFQAFFLCPFEVCAQEKELAEDRIENDQPIQNVEDSIRFYLRQNADVLRQFLNFGQSFEEIEQNLRLVEHYEVIRQQQALNESMLSLRNTMKKRTYIALGVGLVSSSIFLISNGSGNDNDYRGLRYTGAALSLSIPVYSLLTMKKQMDRVAPIQPVDYTQLQSESYPDSPEARSFAIQELKSSIYLIKRRQQMLFEKLNTIPNPAVDVDNNKTQAIFLAQQDLINGIQNDLLSELKTFQLRIQRPELIKTTDGGTREKLNALDQLISAKLIFWGNQKGDLSRRNTSLARWLN